MFPFSELSTIRLMQYAYTFVFFLHSIVRLECNYRQTLTHIFTVSLNDTTSFMLHNLRNKHTFIVPEINKRRYLP